jgi:hypothetical protein
MKGILFFGFVLIVLVVASALLPNKEGFVNPGSDASLLAPQVIVPTVNPKPAPLEGTTPAPYLPPVEKDYGPAYGEISRINTLPYRDPSLEAAPYARLAELLESLKAFMVYEAPSLQTQSDPEIQLPLTTARGDLNRLTDEVAVLKRNPGIGSALTQGQVDDIQANLAYLQRKFRLSVNSASGASSELLEGFEAKPQPTAFQKLTPKQQEAMKKIQAKPAPKPLAAPAPKPVAAPAAKPVAAPAAKPVAAPAPKPVAAPVATPPVGVAEIAATETSGLATSKDLDELVVRIQAEITRLSASGTTDPVMVNRTNRLTEIKNAIETLRTEIKNGTRTESQIPIKKSDIATFLPLMSDPSKPLPQLLKDANLPVSISNIFPAYNSGDATGAKIAQTLFQQYGDSVFKGLSWNVGLKYTSPNEVEVAKFETKTGADSLVPGFTMNGPTGSSIVAFPRGEMESTTAGLEVDRLVGGRPVNPVVKAASFDWKKKSTDICSSIRKRGLDPNDFGCLDPSKVVSPDFSWRGHARMVCTRLLTTPDPGLPETCGCPPLNWPGWRS